VSANYLQNLGIPVLRGRAFTPADKRNHGAVALVNEAFVKRFFKSDENPLDQHFGLDMPELAGTFRIVGVVRDAKFAGWGLDKPARPMFYVPLAQNVDYQNPLMKKLEFRSHFIGGILLVTNMSPGALEAQLTRLLADLDPNLTINSVRTDAAADRSFLRPGARRSQPRRPVRSRGFNPGCGWTLRRHGIFRGAANQRNRHSHGAWRRPAQGNSTVLRGAFKRVLIGLLLGLPLPWVLAVDLRSVVRRFLLGPAPALSVATISLAICSFFAAIIPASRAASISPMNALRME